MQVPFIDLKTQYLNLKQDIDSRIFKVLEHGAFVNGPEVNECEQLLADFVGSKYAVACASGTDALLLPLMALGIGPGDEVITTSFSFIATAEVIHLVGATPVYVDIDPRTFNIDLIEIEKAITKRTKAIIPVSLYGQPADMDEINDIAAKHKLAVIEDAAQSFGAKYKNLRSGHLSQFGATSFFPAKPLGCYGDGGAIFTDDENYYKQLKVIREHGSEKRYYHTRLGVNARLDTIQCAILIAKLKRYPWEISQRNKIASYFSEELTNLKVPGFFVPYVKQHNESVWAQYTLSVPNRSQFQNNMTERNVPTAVHYPHLMPEQPWYESQLKNPLPELKNARWASQHVVSIPIYPDMNLETQNYIINAVKESLV